MRHFLLVSLLPCLSGLSPISASEPSQNQLIPVLPALAVDAADLPQIGISRELGRLAVAFTGTLQKAAGITGPWTDVSGGISPFHPDGSGRMVFYRARVSSPPSIFSSSLRVSLRLTGPFQMHFNLAAAGAPDGIFPPRRLKPPFEGTVVLDGTELPVGLRVRGNSSLQECPFPKLTLKVAKEQRAGTPFFDAREIKIGTHCAEGGHGNVGRLRDERATYREALAYETMNQLGFLSPRVRRAQINFFDTSPSNQGVEGGWQISRQALLLEDPEVVGERLGGRALDDLELEALTHAGFSEQLLVDLRFFHVFIGNWDFALSVNGQGLGNTDVIVMPDGKLVPMAGDFDLCSWVTGEVRSTFPRNYHPEWPDVDRQARYQLEQIGSEVTPEQFIAAQKRFETRREAVESLVGSAELDDEGRVNALRHVRAFFEALSRSPRE